MRKSANAIAIYHLKEGLFRPLGLYTENSADELLKSYERYGLLELDPQDNYSGMYILTAATRKVYDKNVHEYALRELAKNKYDVFCGDVTQGIAAGRQFFFIVHSDINGQPYTRRWPILSIKNTGTGYELCLQTYGTCEVPYGSTIIMVAP